MGFCTQCGAKLNEGAKFCTKCGTAADGPAAQGPYETAPYQNAPWESPPQERMPWETSPFAGAEREAGKKGATPTAPIIIIVAALLVVVSFFVMFMSRGNNDTSTPAAGSYSPQPISPGSAPPAATPPDRAPPGPVTGQTPAAIMPEETLSPSSPSPPPLPPPPVRSYTLSEAIFQTNNWVRLVTYWSGNRATVFERDRDSAVWTMVSRDGFLRIVEPTFSQTPSAFIIGFPTTATEYHLHDDGTGSFGAESLIWEFASDPERSLGSVSGRYMTNDFQAAMSRYMLIVIRVYWNNGQVSIFYRDDNGRWLLRGRAGGTSNVEPAIGFPSNYVTMSFADSSSYYRFDNGGTGSYGNERISWDYSYFGY